MAKSAKKTLDINAFLAQANSANETRSKSKIPIIDDKNLYEAVDLYIKKNQALKNAKTELELSEQPLIAFGKSWYNNLKGTSNSVKYIGESGSILITFKDAFTKISKEVADQLKSILKNKFNNYFKEKRTIAIKASITEDDKNYVKIIEFLLEKLGEEKFLEIFDVELVTVPIEDFDKKQFEVSEDVRNLVQQYKPALRIS